MSADDERRALVDAVAAAAVAHVVGEKPYTYASLHTAAHALSNHDRDRAAATRARRERDVIAAALAWRASGASPSKAGTFKARERVFHAAEALAALDADDGPPTDEAPPTERSTRES